MSLFYVFLTIFFTVYGQIVIKWQINMVGNLPITLNEKMYFFLKLLLNPWIISGFIAAFLASLSWMAAMTKLPLSYAYPFMSLSFIFVLIFSSIFFSEVLTWQKISGIILIMTGVIFISQTT